MLTRDLCWDAYSVQKGIPYASGGLMPVVSEHCQLNYINTWFTCEKWACEIGIVLAKSYALCKIASPKLLAMTDPLR